MAVSRSKTPGSTASPRSSSASSSSGSRNECWRSRRSDPVTVISLPGSAPGHDPLEHAERPPELLDLLLDVGRVLGFDGAARALDRGFRLGEGIASEIGG